MRTAKELAASRPKIDLPERRQRSKDADAVRLGEKLAAQRKVHGVTLAEVGREVGITRAQASNIELGKSFPSLRVLCALSYFYGVGLDYLCEHMRPDAGASAETSGKG